MYEELLAAWKLERNSEVIQPLPSDFFRKAMDYLSGLRESLTRERSGSSMESAKKREINYVDFMLSDLLKMRARKIALLSLEGSELGTALTESETRLLRNMHELLSGYMKQVTRSPAAPEVSPGKALKSEELMPEGREDNSSLMLLRVLQPIPRLVGIDLDEYGPFQPEDIVYLPRENALVLVARGAATEVKL